MSASMNQCNFLGRVGKDPEIQRFDNNSKLAKFHLATEEKYKDKNSDEWITKTTWVPIEISGNSADAVEKYVKKGMTILVKDCSYMTKQWGEGDKKRYGHCFKSFSFEFADTQKSEGGNRGSGESYQKKQNSFGGGASNTQSTDMPIDGDLPF
jgi:single-strand DNA-binding protein